MILPLLFTCKYTLYKEGMIISRNFSKSNSLYNNAPIPKLEIFINGKKILVNPGTTIMQAALKNGIEIPRFCYHDKLSIAGNCRMCLVEVEKMPKPVASCAMPVMNGWKIYTNSDLAKKARESVMEFLLINHPLDCPICDQGGECDLQDQSMAHGNDKSRFIQSLYTGKRAVEDKDIGPLVKTIMNRCIHCTRCVRFMTEIAGVEDLGTTGRGNDMQIGTYVGKMLKSELSGNIIDVCPVGALTSKPNRFAIRPWEMKTFESIDISDAVGSNIVVGIRTNEIMRVLPRPNDSINEDWICDKARFSYDGLKYQRLMVPMKYSGQDMFEPIDWKTALIEIAHKWNKANKNDVYGIVGQIVEAESMLVLRDFFHSYNSENLYIEDIDHPSLATGVDFRCTYLLNNSIENIEESDVLLLIGTSLRYEAPTINARIRKSFIHHGLKIGVLGDKIDATFPYDHLGEDSTALDHLINGTHEFSKIIENAKRPMIILGTKSAATVYGSSLHNKCLKYSNKLLAKLENRGDWKVFNVIQRSAGYVNALDMGYTPGVPNLKNASFIYLVGTDNGTIDSDSINSNCFVVYQGHHGDAGAKLADIILPGCAYTEKDGIYVNTEGRAQLARRCLTAPGDAREDWKILRTISDIAGKPLNYVDIDMIHSRLKQISPHFSNYDEIEPNNFESLVEEINSNSDVKFKSLPSHINKLSDYFMTNAISRNSNTMAQCVHQVLSRQ